jgi:hypothetical protein
VFDCIQQEAVVEGAAAEEAEEEGTTWLALDNHRRCLGLEPTLRV